MLEKSIHWGIIGCGSVCEVKSGPAFQLIEGSLLHAVMRRDTEKAKNFAERHQVPKYYSDAKELINDANIDAVYVATPPSTHAYYTIEALKAGKPVYVEKPMAINFKECKSMISASKKYKTPFFVAYYRRFLAYFFKIKEIINSNLLGTLLNCQINMVLPPRKDDFNKENPPWHLITEISGGGYFFDLACHQLDILDFLLGEVEGVYGFFTNRAGIYKVEDTLAASIRFKSGILGSCNWTYVGNKNNYTDSIEILGTEGKVSFSISTIQPIIINLDGTERSFSYKKPKHIELPMIEQVTKSLLGKNKLESNMYSAARTSWVMDKIMGRL